MIKPIYLILGFYFFINLIRSLEPIRTWMVSGTPGLKFFGTKPWSCDVCMTFWVVLGGVVSAHYSWDLAPVVAGGVLALLRLFPQAPPRPPTLTPE